MSNDPCASRTARGVTVIYGFTYNYNLSIFILCAVAEEGEVGLVAADGYLALDERILDSTARFIRMRTVAKTAHATYTENLWEIMTYLFFLHIHRTKALNTRRINEPTAGGPLRGERIHLGECGGMHTLIMRIGYLTRTRHLFAKKRIE